jgi:signal transduction histidine kinase
MRQALLNILINAIHALAVAEMRELRVRCGAKDEEVYVEIADTGVGIAPADLTQLFCPFFGRKGELAGGEAQHVFRGPGLGLSISYGIVRMHGGEIHVQSREGKGTTFRITIPRP